MRTPAPFIRATAAALLAAVCIHLPRPAHAEPAQTGTWRWQATRLPKALLVEGLWTDVHRLREACHVAGVPYDAAYKSKSPYMRPNTRLYNMPANAPGYAKFSVVVLGNIDAVTLGSERIELLRRFVDNGGGLVVLGGYWAYHRGAYAGTTLADMLPVTFPEENRIPPHEQGLPLAAAPDAGWPALADANFASRPAAFFVQNLIPKAGARVRLRVGDQPAIVTGSFGRGRVVACSLTANGTAPAGVLAFWDWPDWPSVLGAAIDWAAAARPPDGTPGADKGAEPLSDTEITDLAMGLSVTPAIVKRAAARPSAEIAAALLDVALSEEAPCKLADVYDRMVPFAEPGWAARLKDRASPLNPDTEDRNAALVLIGASRADTGYAILLDALPREPDRLAALEGLGLSANPAAMPRLAETYKRAMAAATAKARPEALDPEAFAREHGHVAARAALALYRLGDERGVPRLVSIYTQLVLYERIFKNAGKRRTLANDVQGLAIRKRIWDRARRLSKTVAHLRRHVGPLPAAQVEPFLRQAGAATDPVAVEWALLVIEQSAESLPPETWVPLHDARDGIVARLARTLSGGP